MNTQFPWITMILIIACTQLSMAQKLHIEEDDEAIRIEGLSPKISFHDGSDIRSYLKHSGSQDMLLYNRENGSLFFGTNDDLKMTIDFQGYVGIGTEFPETKLDVVGDEMQIRENDMASAKSFSINTTANPHLEIKGENADIFFHADGNDILINPFTLQGGNVGIGTNVADAKLEVQQAFNGTDNSNAGILLQGNNGSGRMWYDKSNKTFRLQQGAANNEQLVLRNSGQVSVGTSTAQDAQLTVHKGNEQAVDFGVQTGFNPGYVNIQKPAGYGPAITKWKDNTTTMATINGASETYAMTILGSAKSTGGNWVDSDRSLKSNINSLDSSLDKLMKVDPKTYHMKTDDYTYLNFSDEVQIGFLAQDLQKQFPELVKASFITDEDHGQFENRELLSVNYAGLTPILTKAIQEQQALIVKLQEELRAMSERITELEK